MRIAPQATGHNAGPLGALDDTILLNTSMLTGVEIDSARQRVRVGGGTKWKQVIAPLSDLGLAALHGSSPDVGVVGYSLGGGMGWLGRKYGLQAGSVTSIDLVAADGLLHRTDEAHESDLFWALRGGGGNFGVVTSMEFAVYPVREVYAGGMLFRFDRASDLLHAWVALLPSLPDEMTSWVMLLHLPDAPFVPEPMRGGSFAGVMAAFLGSEAEGRQLLSPLRSLGPMMDTFEIVPPGALGDLAMDPPDPLPYRSGHLLLDELPPQAIEPLIEAAGENSGLTIVQLRHLGGTLGRRSPGAGARATLPGGVCMFTVGVTPDGHSMTAVDASLRKVETILQPRRVGRYGSFVEEPTDAREFFDVDTWARLREVKALYDPSDLFVGNHHVPPAR
jgi:FAD/FMN-containing dehydrogenase